MASVVPSNAERTSPFGVHSLLVCGPIRRGPDRRSSCATPAGASRSIKGARTDCQRPQESELGDRFSLAFISPGLVAVGSRTLIRGAVDRQNGGGKTMLSSQAAHGAGAVMRDRDAWAVGRLDVADGSGSAAAGCFRASFRRSIGSPRAPNVNGGIRGVVQVEAADEEAANNLREVVRGFVALGRLQSHSQPAVKAFLDTLVLGGERNGRCP